MSASRGKRALLLVIAPFLIAAPLTGSAQQDSNGEIHCVFSTALVMLTVTATDSKSHPVTDLTRNDFFVTDRNTPQTIAAFSREDRPRSVGIVVSSSVATRAGWLNSLLQNLRTFKELGHEMNEYFIIAAGATPHLVADWTRDSDAFVEGLTNVASLNAIGGGSAIYDALAVAHKKLDERETFGSVIILISDGNDASRLSYADLRESFKRSGALIYSICFTDQGSSSDSTQVGLKKLSAVSGGTSYDASSASEASRFLERIATELHHQYVVGYYPTDARRDGSWHRVKVLAYSQTGSSSDVVPLVVRTLSGYNAPSEVQTPDNDRSHSN